MPDIALVRKRVQRAIEQARRDAADRRARVHAASAAYDEFLETRAIPAFRALAVVLKAEGMPWDVMTPSGEVRLSPERQRDNAIGLAFDATADPPQPMVRVVRTRGGRVTESERPVKSGVPDSAALTEDDVVEMLIDELRPWFER
jgi:hypothetical protein